MNGLINYINLKLAALGQPTSRDTADVSLLDIAEPLLRNHHQKDLLLGDRLCSVDSRIQSFLDSYLADQCPEGASRLPAHTFVLDRPGLARILSLPSSGDQFTSDLLKSYRVAQGVLHNPASDRRTTQGIFHIVEGGLPIPADKIAVPKQAFAGLLREAVRPPADTMRLPFTSHQTDESRTFVSLLLRPLVCPGTGAAPPKTMEIRFFAPGSLVSNLDFVEGIFGNGGDPYLPENNAALDVMHWTGHYRMRDSRASPRRDEEEGSWPPAVRSGDRAAASRWDVLARPRREIQRRARIQACLPGRTRRDGNNHRRQLLRLLQEGSEDADFVRSEPIRLSEEEHAGGALAFATYVLGQNFSGGRTVAWSTRSLTMQ